MTLVAPVPPIPAHPLLVLLLDLLLLLGLALLLGRLAERMRMPAVVGELTTGLLLGPSVLGHAVPGLSGWLLPHDAEQIHLIDAVGQLGVLLLVALAGTHIDMSLMRRRGTTALWVSGGGLFIPLALGITAGLLLPASLMPPGGHSRGLFATFLGVAMCVTAIPVIAKTLTDVRLMHRNVGQLTLAAGTVDDTVGWFLLSVVSAAATVGLTAGRVALSVVYLVAFILVAVLIGRPLVRLLLGLAAKSDEATPTVATAVVVVLGGAAVTHSLGMEPVFGAFVAGILIARAGVRVQIRLAPLRTVVTAVLAPLFLATAGLRVDLTELRRPTVALAAVVLLTIAIAGKFAGAYLGARIGRLSHWEGIALGAGMNARGVVEVVVAMVGLRLGVLSTATYSIVVLIAIVTSIMAPPILRASVSRIEQREDERLRKLDHDAWNGALPDAAPAPRSEAA